MARKDFDIEAFRRKIAGITGGQVAREAMRELLEATKGRPLNAQEYYTFACLQARV